MSNKYPYTDFHELNLDWILEEIQKLKNLTWNRNGLYPTVTWYYVNGLHGNDLFDGSEHRPFKTLRKAFETAYTHGNDCRVYITAPGEYLYEWELLNAVGLHITATVPDVIIKASKNIATYNSRINLRGSENGNMKIIINHPDKLFYLDGGNIALNYVDMECHLRLNAGSGGGAQFSALHNLTCYDSQFIFYENCSIEDPVVDRASLYCFNANIFIFKSITINYSQNIIYPLFYVYGGGFNYGEELINLTGNKAAIVKINHCTYTSSQTDYNNLSNFADVVEIGPVVASNLTL